MPRSFILFSCAVLAIAQQPDRSPLADEWGYRPADGSTATVNPPSLTWVHEKGATAYTVEWAASPDFRNAVRAERLPWPAYTHNRTLAPGTYHWRYRIHGPAGKTSPWSTVRKFTLPPEAPAFPQPTLAEMRALIGTGHPRLFVSAKDLDRLRTYSKGPGKEAFARLIREADSLIGATPTPEPTVMGDSRNPATRDHWWSNRLRTLKALREGEVLSFAALLTGDPKYSEPARAFALKLAAWSPDGPTKFALNCEAAKPMLHRLARIYDWSYGFLSEDERARFRAVLLRRAKDAWISGEVREGAGHLNQPYSSHGNRTWHKLAENAIATLGETPESDRFLEYAVTKFFAAYPAWSDEDGGWHEGLSYFAGYMSKAAWWMHLSGQSLGIDGFRKPFFAHFGDYALYSAPPGAPDLGFGDLSTGPLNPATWAFMSYFVRQTRNPHWAWWSRQWNLPEESGEPVLAFLWSAMGDVTFRPPSGLPPSKHFRGTGIAVLNTTLETSAENVQVRFKSSPMGRWSHGHDPHNSFTLTAYGEPLLVNNVYRDIYGSPFHKDWVWTTRAQNAVLVNGEGQKPHSADAGGAILVADLRDGLDYLLGDATAAYEGRLTKALRHVVFVKPDVILIADELAAPSPATYQFMLHGQREFQVDAAARRLILERGKAGVVADFRSPSQLTFRQWTGYSPEPDKKYLLSIERPMIPDQWHVEAATANPAPGNLTFTVLRPYRKGERPESDVEMERTDAGIRMQVRGASGGLVTFESTAESVTVRKGTQEWRIARQ